MRGMLASSLAGGVASSLTRSETMLLPMSSACGVPVNIQVPSPFDEGPASQAGPLSMVMDRMSPGSGSLAAKLNW